MKLRRIRRKVLVVLVSVMLLFFVGISLFMGGALIAPANRRVGPAPDSFPAESVAIPSDSGSKISGWHSQVDGAKATVILLHPIRGDRRAMLERAKIVRNAGFSALLIDLQAHGESPGKHITAGYLERHDVKAAVNWVRAQNPDHKVGIIGWSLGGASALLATPLDIDALVLESVYPTIADAVHDRIAIRLGPLHYLLAPVLLAQLHPRLGISPRQLRPIDHIPKVGCPVLVASGDIDEHTTLSETERLYAAAMQPKELVIFRGAAHTDLLEHDRKLYEDRILVFLKSQLKTRKGGPGS
jgi:fermentation-respiration switch protein FrsA (DUF1100 family)